MAFEFKRKSRKGAGSGLDDRSMADRIKREAERFEEATDSGYTTCLCFRSEAERDRFCGLTSLPNRRYVTGEELRRAAAPFKPDKVRRGFPRDPKSPEKTPNPLAGVDYSQDLERASYDEAMALKAALVSARAPEPLREVTDTDVWICAVFGTRADSDDFLDGWGVRRFGDAYLDASSWLREIEGKG